MQPAPRGWDLPVRAFHWGLVALATFSFVTGKLGGSWLAWHMKSGYAILALLLFRFAWGVVGPPQARFTTFVRGPGAARAYWRALRAGAPHPAGHNPLGGWMVVAMLLLLSLQAASGLYTTDESSHEGPLAATASNDLVDRLSALHAYNQWTLVAVVAVHVLAILAYRWAWRIDLLGPMVRGDLVFPPRAWAALIGSVALVYWLVAVFPGWK